MSFFILVLLLSIAVGYYFLPREIVFVRRKDKHIPRGKYQLLTFISKDKLSLEAYFSPSLSDRPKGLVILLHGIRSQKEIFYEMSAVFAAAGYSSIALDLRAHGRSEGKYCTFGVREQEDVLQIIDYAMEQKLAGYHHIGIVGKSLGGAIAYQLLATNKRLQFGIIESAMADLTKTVQHYFKRSIGLSYLPLIQYFINRASQIADFDANQIDIAASCRAINQPMLLVHGTLDKSILITQGKSNYEILATNQKEFLEIPSGGHKDLWQIGGIAYYQKLADFIDTSKSPSVK